MLNGFCSMNTPRRWSISKVSRAEWPTASTTWLASICSPPSSSTPRSVPASISKSVTLVPKRYSPPRRSISARMLSTIVTRRKVPICGLETYMISSGAPALTNSARSFRE